MNSLKNDRKSRCLNPKIVIWGHSTTTWTNFDPILTPPPPPSSGQAWTFYVHMEKKSKKSLSPITDNLAHKKTQVLVFNHLLCTASSSQS